MTQAQRKTSSPTRFERRASFVIQSFQVRRIGLGERKAPPGTGLCKPTRSPRREPVLSCASHTITSREVHRCALSWIRHQGDVDGADGDRG
jgi:hypothetical protein